MTEYTLSTIQFDICMSKIPLPTGVFRPSSWLFDLPVVIPTHESCNWSHLLCIAVVIVCQGSIFSKYSNERMSAEALTFSRRYKRSD